MSAVGQQPDGRGVRARHPHPEGRAGRPQLDLSPERPSTDPGGVIVLLGAPNDAAGTLSSVALERCRLALAEHRAAPGWAVLPTGGFGAFNRSPAPHAHLTRRWLLAHGVPERDVLAPVLSRFTVEDALLTEPVVARSGVRALRVVTSDFHLERARWIFERVFSGYRLAFSGSPTALPRAELARLRAHEAAALAELKRRPGPLR